MAGKVRDEGQIGKKEELRPGQNISSARMEDILESYIYLESSHHLDMSFCFPFFFLFNYCAGILFDNRLDFFLWLVNWQNGYDDS